MWIVRRQGWRRPVHVRQVKSCYAAAVHSLAAADQLPGSHPAWIGRQSLHDHSSGVLPSLHAHLSQACLQAEQKLQGTANAQPLYVCPLLSSQQTGPDIVPAALGGITSLLSAASQQLQAGGKPDDPTGGLDTCIPLGVTSDS